MQKLKGQRALVTGASSGIGKAIALELGRNGADVVVNYRSGDDVANAVAEEIRAGGVRAYTHRADVSQEADVVPMFQRISAEFGGIDILVNNAGLQKDAEFHDMTIDQWNTVIGVNLTGQFLCAREAIRCFRRQGIRPEVSRALGKIVCISSV
ncbi:MAG: SDR family NAD(P)-dependent oxidoreductase, partial [Bryobacterales bacterium]|nr:SDR family NAD(P)-dependent oxidoreductase [Bryobacterales bacterium]